MQFFTDCTLYKFHVSISRKNDLLNNYEDNTKEKLQIIFNLMQVNPVRRGSL